MSKTATPDTPPLELPLDFDLSRLTDVKRYQQSIEALHYQAMWEYFKLEQSGKITSYECIKRVRRYVSTRLKQLEATD